MCEICTKSLHVNQTRISHIICNVTIRICNVMICVKSWSDLRVGSLYKWVQFTKDSDSFQKRKSGDFLILLVLKNRQLCVVQTVSLCYFWKNRLVKIQKPFCSFFFIPQNDLAQILLILFIESFIDLMHSKKSSKEPYILSKEPYILSKEPYS